MLPLRVSMKKTSLLIVAAIVGSTSCVFSAVAAEKYKRLSGSQIRAKVTGMQLTDEVHYRFVYERDGTLRSYAMGVEKVGKWTIESDQLCLYFLEPDDGCYEISLSSSQVVMKPSGLGGAIDGVLQPPAELTR
jgi:hypothetical protein